MKILHIETRAGSTLVDITDRVQEAIRDQGLQSGVCVLFVPHTTVGLTLNENWDPDVCRDMLLTLDEIAPDDRRHRHSEGNSPAHLKSTLFGASLALIVEGGQVLLGRWQGVYLADFDGPRRREVWLKTVKSGD